MPNRLTKENIMDWNLKNTWNTMQKHGKKKYITISTLMIGIILPVVNNVIDLIRGKEIRLERFILCIAIYSIMGYFGAHLSWGTVERQISRENLKESNMKVEINYCYFCGEKLENSEDICPSCGNKLEI